MNKKNTITIAIDGFSSTGKSSLAEGIAQHFNWVHIDSGAMYRGVTLYGIQNYWNQELQQINTQDLVENLTNINLKFKTIDNTLHLFLNTQDVEKQIRALKVSNQVSSVAKIKEIRTFLVQQQREIAKNVNVVMDGRDIGTVVFPLATVKFFITAEVGVRAKRRFKDIKINNPSITLEEVSQNLLDRDAIDVKREHSPLTKASDAILIDNTYKTKQETLQEMIQLIENKISKEKHS